jgi:hypothetical protein
VWWEPAHSPEPAVEGSSESSAELDGLDGRLDGLDGLLDGLDGLGRLDVSSGSAEVASGSFDGVADRVADPAPDRDRDLDDDSGTSEVGSGSSSAEVCGPTHALGVADFLGCARGASPVARSGRGVGRGVRAGGAGT